MFRCRDAPLNLAPKKSRKEEKIKVGKSNRSIVLHQKVKKKTKEEKA